MTEPIVVLWNQGAGSAEKNAHVREELQRRKDVRLFDTESAREATQLAREAAERGVEIVVACGGDGTVSAAVRGLIESGAENVTLAILPLGTGNDLCRTLEIPFDVAEAARLFELGATHALDVVRVESNGETGWFLNMATGGNTGDFMNQLTAEMKSRWGPFCYARGVVDVLADLTVYDVELTCDDDPPEQFNALNIILANGRTSGGGMRAAPHANPEDGLLEVIVVLDGTAMDIAALTTRYFVGNYRESELIFARSAKSVTVRATPNMWFSADGDLLTDEPVKFTVEPQAIQILTGAMYSPRPQFEEQPANA